jgi:hypothetical protein
MSRDDPLVRGIRMQELVELVQMAKNKETILIILDCCYSGVATEGKGEETPGVQQIPFAEWFGALEHEERGRGRVILASSGHDEESRELVQQHELVVGEEAAAHHHGTFTFHLLEGLDGKAATQDNERITLGGLRNYIDEQMRNDAEHQPTFSGAGMIRADQIVVAKANRWREIERKLRSAKDLLDKNHPKSSFNAVKTFGSVMPMCGRMRKAAELKGEIDKKLSQYRALAVRWLADSWWDLGINFSDDFWNYLQERATRLSVDTILRERSWIPLLLNLCEVSCKKPNCDEAYVSKEVFVEFLQTEWSTFNQPTSGVIANPPTSGPPKLGGTTNG